MSADAAHALRQQTIAAQRLITSLREMGEGEDAALVADTVEGETQLHEAVARVMDEIDECEIHIAGLKLKEEAFESRRAAFEKRREMLKAAIERAMVEAETPNIKLATRTAYLSRRAPNVLIEDEAAIPSRFWTQPAPPEPKIDKNGLKAALKLGEDVPGARLDNGSVSLSLR